ncbi:CopD family protein [candidate division KSB1 bacterium]|nr:CopD family protein [candidate division KSB1 bacterium]
MMFQVLVDFLHLLATVTWIGGMIYINLVLMPAMPVLSPPERGKLMGAASKRFALFAWGSIVILLLTGFYKTPEGMLFDVSADYSLTLTVKHVVVLTMIIIGIVISMVIVPKLGALAPKPQEAPSPAFIALQNRLKVLAIINMIMGFVVLLCVVLLQL